MLELTKNNWYTYKYINGKFETNYAATNEKIKSFQEELQIAASEVIDKFHKPSLFFSGGADSEVMLRAFMDIGYNPTVYIVRYENDYNLYDVSYAVAICSMLNANYKILDFNLRNFYTNEAEKISELSEIDRPKSLVYAKFLELVDYPILGEGDPYIIRFNQSYDEVGDWKFIDAETFIGWYKYAEKQNIQCIPMWFKWSAGLVLSHLNTDWCQKLLSDQIYGKLGTNSTKLIGYREVYPNMIDRVKQTGFEKIDNLVDEFEKFLYKKYNSFPYRQLKYRTIPELYSEILT